MPGAVFNAGGQGADEDRFSKDCEADVEQFVSRVTQLVRLTA